VLSDPEALVQTFEDARLKLSPQSDGVAR
jgi:hypothetical protein